MASGTERTFELCMVRISDSRACIPGAVPVLFPENKQKNRRSAVNKQGYPLDTFVNNGRFQAILACFVLF